MIEGLGFGGILLVEILSMEGGKKADKSPPRRTYATLKVAAFPAGIRRNATETVKMDDRVCATSVLSSRW